MQLFPDCTWSTYLTMVQITFENDQLRLGQMQEQVGSFSVHFPERVTGTPERMLFINPFTLPLVLLSITSQ